MNLSAAQLQRKREKKAARRRFLAKKRLHYITLFGAYVGIEMFRAWRRRDNPRAFPAKPIILRPAVVPQPKKLGWFELIIAALKNFVWRIAHADHRTPAAPAS